MFTVTMKSGKQYRHVFVMGGTPPGGNRSYCTLVMDTHPRPTRRYVKWANIAKTEKEPCTLWNIDTIDKARAAQIIEAPQAIGNRGRFMMNQDGLCGIDNRDGNAWTEDFYSPEVCRRWLLGDMEIDEARAVEHRPLVAPVQFVARYTVAPGTEERCTHITASSYSEAAKAFASRDCMGLRRLVGLKPIPQAVTHTEAIQKWQEGKTYYNARLALSDSRASALAAFDVAAFYHVPMEETENAEE